jgi:hypothetical protein
MWPLSNSNPAPIFIPLHFSKRAIIAHTAIIESSHVTPPANLENSQVPTILFESAIAATNQGPADTPTIPPPAGSEVDLHSIPAASTPTTQLLAALPSSSTAAAEQHNADLGGVPHSIVSVMPFSPFSITSSWVSLTDLALEQLPSRNTHVLSLVGEDGLTLTRTV